MKATCDCRPRPRRKREAKLTSVSTEVVVVVRVSVRRIQPPNNSHHHQAAAAKTPQAPSLIRYLVRCTSRRAYSLLAPQPKRRPQHNKSPALPTAALRGAHHKTAQRKPHAASSHGSGMQHYNTVPPSRARPRLSPPPNEHVDSSDTARRSSADVSPVAAAGRGREKRNGEGGDIRAAPGVVVLLRVPGVHKQRVRRPGQKWCVSDD